MSWHVRAARGGDLDALHEFALLTGGGFTNLPMDKGALAERLAWSDESYARVEDTPQDELYILVLEQGGTGRLGGCGMVFSRIGAEWPFYSYKLGTLSQTSTQLGRTFKMDFLSLTTDHDGASEVGGLFLHPDLRTGGLGRLVARARYLFIAQHRSRFGEKVIAELRGVMDKDGNSPFWDALGRQFFGMSFPEADRFNAVHGSQFIADLMPKHPVYTALLSEAARAVIGQPHPTGRAALAMLEAEGFAYDNYVDIFDGGPTVSVRTSQIKTIRESRAEPIAELREHGDGLARAIIAAGRLTDFCAWLGYASSGPDGAILTAGEAEAMGKRVGDEVRHVAI
jgi:arginine N-succinyltransferase